MAGSKIVIDDLIDCQIASDRAELTFKMTDGSKRKLVCSEQVLDTVVRRLETLLSEYSMYKARKRPELGTPIKLFTRDITSIRWGVAEDGRPVLWLQTSDNLTATYNLNPDTLQTLRTGISELEQKIQQKHRPH